MHIVFCLILLEVIMGVKRQDLPHVFKPLSTVYIKVLTGKSCALNSIAKSTRPFRCWARHIICPKLTLNFTAKMLFQEVSFSSREGSPLQKGVGLIFVKSCIFNVIFWEPIYIKSRTKQRGTSISHVSCCTSPASSHQHHCHVYEIHRASHLRGRYVFSISGNSMESKRTSH